MSDLPLITSEDLDALEPEWATLHSRVPGASPFLHPEWHRVWLRNFGQEAAPVFLSVRRGEELVGVAAFDMDRDVARELGDHNVRDYAGPLALPGEEPAVAAGILEWLREDLTPGAHFWGLPVDSPMLAALSDAASAGGWSFEQEHEAVCPGVDLPGDFEDFVAALSKKDRHELRRKMRNFEAAGVSAFSSVTTPEDVAAALPGLFHLMRISRGDKDEFLTPQMEAFFHDLGRTFGALGMVRLSTLSLDDAPVAMTLAFEDGATTYLYNSGYDPAHSHLAVGLVSKAHAIRDGIERGLTRFDFLRGEEDYKRRLGGVDREVVSARLGATS
jgi:CelD/BcsL family acetyltransferase involved in cellulose biosynthesis